MILGGLFGSSNKNSAPAVDFRKIKGQIVSVAAGTSNGLAASPEKVARIEELARALEQNCPVRAPADSPLSDGEWMLVYTTNKGDSAGKVGPFVGKVTQVIMLEDERYFNIVEVGPLRAELEATWIVRGAKNWTVIFKTLAVKLFGMQLLQSEFDVENARGDWIISYVDEDFRIIRATGREGVTNIYILVKPDCLLA